MKIETAKRTNDSTGIGGELDYDDEDDQWSYNINYKHLWWNYDDDGDGWLSSIITTSAEVAMWQGNVVWFGDENLAF